MLLKISGTPSLLLMLFDLTRLAVLSLCSLHQQEVWRQGTEPGPVIYFSCHQLPLRVVFCLIKKWTQ